MGGFITCHLTPELNEGFKFIYDPKKSLVSGQAYVAQELYSQIASINNDTWVSIVRHSPIDELKEFYSDIPGWNMEQHGAGPRHYAAEYKKNVFEIYPNRLENSSKMEFVVIAPDSRYVPHGREDSPTEDLDGRQIRFFQ
ncbi:MAG: hypothetical protein C0514_01635 [Candidatus Puniceispirillum sp.]|nr:hypothetical protein [Candidatus Puniceispirillum sp.]